MSVEVCALAGDYLGRFPSAASSLWRQQLKLKFRHLSLMGQLCWSGRAGTVHTSGIWGKFTHSRGCHLWLFSGILPSLWPLWPPHILSSDFSSQKGCSFPSELRVTHLTLYPWPKASSFPLASKICLPQFISPELSGSCSCLSESGGEGIVLSRLCVTYKGDGLRSFLYRVRLNSS